MALIGLGLVGAPSTAAGQESTPYSVTILGEGAVLFHSPEAIRGILVGNSVLIEGELGSLLIDTGLAATSTALGSAVAEIRPSPLRWIVNTHPHLDHLGGVTQLLRSSQSRGNGRRPTRSPRLGTLTGGRTHDRGPRPWSTRVVCGPGGVSRNGEHRGPPSTGVGAGWAQRGRSRFQASQQRLRRKVGRGFSLARSLDAATLPDAVPGSGPGRNRTCDLGIMSPLL